MTLIEELLIKKCNTLDYRVSCIKQFKGKPLNTCFTQ